MKTARFLIAVTHDVKRELRLERQLRRADEGRAVLCAQTWLVQLRMTQHYFGVELNQYEVYSMGDDERWHPVEIGDVSHAEMGRARVRAKREEAKGAPIPGASTASGGRKRGAKATQSKGTWPGSAPTFKRGQAQRSSKTLSPIQQRIQQLKDNARRTLDDKRACGESK